MARDDSENSERTPFAEFVRIVGRGPGRSRHLTEAEAEAAMSRILAGDLEPEALGGFLVVMRYRKESAEEFAGFTRAARQGFAANTLKADLDWPSYADRHKQLPYFVLAAQLLAGAGIQVLMHGLAGEGPATTPRALAALGIAPSMDFNAAAEALDRQNFAYLPVEAFCPGLGRLFALRPVLGVRTPANTFARMLNPANAPCQIQGVFHPTYLETHREASLLLGQRHLAVFKGGGGEVQCNPEKATRVFTLSDGMPGVEEWPALLAGQRHAWRDEVLDVERVRELWRGTLELEGPVAAIVGTVAIALKMLGRADSHAASTDLAAAMWRERDRNRLTA